MKQVRLKVGSETFLGDHQGQSIEIWEGPDLRFGRATGEFIPAESAILLSPCRPGKIIGIAENYPGVSRSKTPPDEALVFMKPGSAVIGPNETIVIPDGFTRVWGECELAVVLSQALSKSDEREALNAILGYTIANDVTAESPAGYDHHLIRSKGADTFCPVGPWIDTEYEPLSQAIRGFQNEELLREGTLGQRLRGTVTLLSWLSQWMTLEAGDVLLTGAPSRTRDRLYLGEGDVFRCEISGLGVLENHVSRVGHG